MFRPRKIESLPQWSDPDGIKIYTLSLQNEPVNQAPYLVRLAEVKKIKAVAWPTTPAFVIFHDGASYRYLVLAWWGNDNELFTSVSVETETGWVEDPARYSFCLYDLEIFWHERKYFMEFIYCAKPSIVSYRASRYSNANPASLSAV